MSSGFGTLRHDNVGMGSERFLDMAHVLTLTNQDGASTPYIVEERARITKREHNGRRIALQRVDQQGRRALQRPCDEAHTDPFAIGGIELLRKPSRIAIATAD